MFHPNPKQLIFFIPIFKIYSNTIKDDLGVSISGWYSLICFGFLLKYSKQEHKRDKNDPFFYG